MAPRRAVVHDADMPKAKPTRPSIDAVLDEFVTARRAQLLPVALCDCEDALELLRDSLNGYAYESLTATERRRWQKAFDAGDETAFCRLFEAEKLLDHLEEFFDYFMVRKVMADQAFLHSTGAVVADLVRWLGERGYVEAPTVQAAVERAEAATDDLLRADRLGSLLYEATRSAAPIDLDALTDGDYVEDFLEITRIEPGALWFSGDIGPVSVPAEAARFAEVGWSVNVVLARTDGRWQLVEVGNVYPH